MASRGSYSKSYIGKGGGGKQLGGPIKAPRVTAPKMAQGVMPPTPKARPQKMGAMPRSPGYFKSGQVY